ncbi:MAG: TetR/AcrR family transcriptional regulator [Parvularculaceae bacterium]|nr:TetR/AcrR family transcriptional regulator [Parvularculaceae bacterium]
MAQHQKSRSRPEAKPKSPAKSTRPAKPKWRRRADARPDEILDAALAVFNERGFDAARMDDIANRAGISKGAVYLYFDAKEALLRGLIEREVSPTAMRLKALAETGADDPLAALKLIVQTATQLLNDQHIFAVPKLVISVAARFPELGEFYRKRVVDEAIGAFAQLHREGVARGVFRDVDSDAAARAVLGPIFLFTVRKHLLGARTERVSTMARAEAHLDILLNGLSA